MEGTHEQQMLLRPDEAWEYSFMDERARTLLHEWIASHVDGEMLWSETSLGMMTSFQEWEAGFRVTHNQFKAAMLRMGFAPRFSYYGVWLFDRVVTVPSPLPTP